MPPGCEHWPGQPRQSAEAGQACTASKLVKVTAKSVFRAVLIGGANHATLAHSPSLTVKLK